MRSELLGFDGGGGRVQGRIHSGRPGSVRSREGDTAVCEACEQGDFGSCLYDAIVVRGRIDKGLGSASQMRVIAYERGGHWYDASTGAPTTEAEARAEASAFVASKADDSPYCGGRIELRRVRLRREVQIG